MRLFERKASRIPILLRTETSSFARGMVINISGNGLGVATKLKASVNDNLEIKFAGGAIFNATVKRTSFFGLGLKLEEPLFIQKRLDELLDQTPDAPRTLSRLQLYKKDDDDRIDCDGKPVTLQFNNETKMAALINISATGAAIVSTVQLSDGQAVLLDGIPGHVVRNNYLLTGIKFDRLLEENMLNDQIQSSATEVA
ncbi:MAG: PilZ domain-containing protein [Pseudomonadota bacterium]